MNESPVPGQGQVSQDPADLERRPNILYVFADQWRAQATGYAGDPNAITPHLDAFASGNLNLPNAVSGCPVCCPYRGSLLTGCHPLTHGIFINDVPLSTRPVPLGQAFASAGYQTAYIGKWHVDGRGRSRFIPRERRLGFDYWRVLECTHDYNHSPYYADDPKKRFWPGYDAEAQTADAQQFFREHASANTGKPFAMVLSWGPPHNPYESAPARFAAMFDPASVRLRPNVPPAFAEQARRDLAGYYAHIAALDDCFGRLLATLQETKLDRNTIVIFTSDHGDMLGSQGQHRKQSPWDESIRVPFLMRDPRHPGPGRSIDLLINTPDIMPTLLGLCGVPIPATVEGRDYSPILRGQTQASGPPAALLTCIQPFSEWSRERSGREYRGLRTHRHTYVRSLSGAWLFYDDLDDPFQQNNLVNKPEAAAIQRELDGMLDAMLSERGDEFLPGATYLERWGYVVDASGAVPYEN